MASPSERNRASENEEEMEVENESCSEDEEIENEQNESQVYIPGQMGDAEDEQHLERDDSAYHMYHVAQTGSPCLSFDIIRDKLGDNRSDYPHSVYLVAGTQAEKSHLNNVIVMKMSNLHKTFKESQANNDSDTDSDSEDEDEKPELLTTSISHMGAVNRIRTTVLGETCIAASFSERGPVHLWDLSKQLSGLEDARAMSQLMKEPSQKPLFTFTGHQTEGYALDWSPTVPGRLATGDCKKNIHLWNLDQSGSSGLSGSWLVDQRPYTGHTASVEDIQWSPNEQSVFASCSMDKTIRVWDCRASPHKACMLTTEAHDSDVNVISWNRTEPFIVSGGDDGLIKIWDLRQFQKGKAVAKFKHHSAPVTSVEWHPQDSTVYAAAGADNQVTLWDLAVESDSSGGQEGGGATQQLSIPPQLLFIHQGQKDVKELHWHPQIPGMVVTTAHDGFNVFKTISV